MAEGQSRHRTREFKQSFRDRSSSELDPSLVGGIELDVVPVCGMQMK